MVDQRRVLIIDDDRRTVDKLQEEFVQSGYEAEIALSVPVGLSILEERHMSVAVLSASLGHKANWELVKTLKKFDPGLPVVLFNGPKEKGLSKEARRAGAAWFLASPVDFETVVVTARKVMRN